MRSKDLQILPRLWKHLQFYHDLFKFAPPGTSNAFYAEMNDAFISGQAAMVMNYFAFFPALDQSRRQSECR